MLIAPGRCRKRWKRAFREGWRRRFLGWEEKEDPDKIRHVSLGPPEETQSAGKPVGN